MNKHHLLLVFTCTIIFMRTVSSCPCMPSSSDKQPFFEEHDDRTDEQSEENNKEEATS